MRLVTPGALLLLLVATTDVFSGTVSIMVSEGKKASCLRNVGPDHDQYLLDVKETLTALGKYFRGERNPELYDAAIVNAGLKFCSEAERAPVFAWIVRQFDKPAASKNTFEVATNYYRDPAMQRLIQEQLNSPSTSAQLRMNLEKLKSFASKAWSAK